MRPDPSAVHDKAAEQRGAATEAVELLVQRLGPDFGRFARLYDAASFRFGPALRERVVINDEEGRTRPSLATAGA